MTDLFAYHIARQQLSDLRRPPDREQLARTAIKDLEPVHITQRLARKPGLRTPLSERIARLRRVRPQRA